MCISFIVTDKNVHVIVNVIFAVINALMLYTDFTTKCKREYFLFLLIDISRYFFRL